MFKLCGIMSLIKMMITNAKISVFSLLTLRLNYLTNSSKVTTKRWYDAVSLRKQVISPAKSSSSTKTWFRCHILHAPNRIRERGKLSDGHNKVDFFSRWQVCNEDRWARLMKKMVNICIEWIIFCLLMLQLSRCKCIKN